MSVIENETKAVNPQSFSENSAHEPTDVIVVKL